MAESFTRGARQSTLRELNLGLVVRQVFANPGALARADVAAATGMTRSTVSRLVDELLEAGILAEDEPETRGRGRPSVPLRPASGTALSVGLEVSAEHLATTAIDLTGEIVAERFKPGDFAGTEPAETLALLAREAVATLADAHAPLMSVRLALPGIVDQGAEMLLRAPTLGWSRVRARSMLEAGGLRMGDASFALGNEADYAALTVAQSAPGRPSDLDSFLYISGNLGTGSALVVGGEVWTGPHGWAGELGHMCVDPVGLRCRCGARGCLETIAGRKAILNASGRPDWATVVADSARPDYDLALVLDRAGTALGVALASALNLLDISHVVLGGQLAQLAPALLPAIEAEIAVRVLSAPFAPVQVSVRPGGQAPAALGAAYRGAQSLLDDPAQALMAPSSGD